MYPNVEKIESGPAHRDATGSYWDRRDAAVESACADAKEQFLRAVRTQKPTDRCGLTTVSDYCSGVWKSRPATVSEAMEEAANQTRKLTVADVMATLALIANKGDVDAQAMVERLADAFAEQAADAASDSFDGDDE